ncbi:nuclear transport factor 2 family protein [Lacimicrobium sp. SS2-24]|uniref:YybH family protein n=1 Tax=Lacimicrobium sp. SS2-24 TaxID=2005569 RepID=UPI001AEFB792|nr:nuclear transport factor 2 family protein [Lacimicrobium sp. SS2-24]
MVRLFLIGFLFNMSFGVIADDDTPESELLQLQEQVYQREQAFADTMAARDFVAFQSFLHEDAIFFTDTDPLRGKQAVSKGWQRYYQDDAAPFSWQPLHVEVLASGHLAHSSGPVFNPQGECVATFNSIWQKEPDGQWLVVFDKGSPGCPN